MKVVVIAIFIEGGKDMNDISIEMFPALSGDSFLITCYGEKNRYILVDFGYKTTYRNHLKNRLKELALTGNTIELAIITHIDRDHINGALPFFEENGCLENPSIIYVNDVWHNSFRHFQFAKREEGKISECERNILEEVLLEGYPEEENDNVIERDEEISAEDGTYLGALLVKGKYNWNRRAGGQAIQSELPPMELADGIKLIILSPNKQKLELLESEWRDYIVNEGFITKITDEEIFDDAFEYYLAKLKDNGAEFNEDVSDSLNMEELSSGCKFVEDKAINNGSSISFILEFREKKILFLGDSHPSVIENKLKILYKEENFPINFDAIKVSHHGSMNNTSPELLKLIDSETYLISTNGKKHNHPDKETIARIVNRKTKYVRNLYFNYNTNTAQEFNNKEFKEKYNYQIITELSPYSIDI